MVEGRRAGKKEKDRRHDDRRMAGDRAFREEHRKVEERQQERHEEEDARCDCGAQVSHENGEVGRRQRKTSAAMQHEVGVVDAERYEASCGWGCGRRAVRRQSRAAPGISEAARQHTNDTPATRNWFGVRQGGEKMP